MLKYFRHMKVRFNKKIILGFIGMISIAAITAPILVSCSSSPSVIETITCKLNSNTFTIKNSITVNPGIEINGTTYTSSPGFDSTDINKQQATAVFDIIGAFSSWMYGTGSTLATLISRSPTTKNLTNPVTLPTSISNNGLDYALASYISSGKDTYRLGLKSINVESATLINDISSKVLQYIEPTTENIDNSFILVTDKNNPDADRPKTALSLSNISLTFSWWRSESAGIRWIENQSDVDAKSKIDFLANAPDNVTPQYEYTLNINNLIADLNQYSLATIDGNMYWYPSGRLRIVENNKSPFYYGADGSNISELLNYITIANNVAAGDVTNMNFDNYIKNDKGGEFINQNLGNLIS